MERKACAIFAGVVLSLMAGGPLHAADSDADTQARQGVVRCGGSNFTRQMGTEVHFTSYNFRNFGTAPITIERLVFFDANGGVLFDSNADGFPTFSNGVLGAGDHVLDPNQTAQLDSTDVLPFLPQNQRPIQLEVTWSAPERVLTLNLGLVRIVRARNATTGQQLEERSRHSSPCRTISLRR